MDIWPQSGESHRCSCSQDLLTSVPGQQRRTIPILPQQYTRPRVALLRVFLSKFLYRLHRSPNGRPGRIYLIPSTRGFSILMLFGLHGASALKILIIISINYLISCYAGGSRIGPFFLWVFNALVLFANEAYSGYRFASLHSSLEFMVCPSSSHLRLNRFRYQDNIQGAYPRWHVSKQEKYSSTSPSYWNSRLRSRFVVCIHDVILPFSYLNGKTDR